MNDPDFFQVDLIGLRLRNRYGIPRDLFTKLIWKWIPPAPAIHNAPFTDVVIDCESPHHKLAEVGDDYYTSWHISNSTVTLMINTGGDVRPSACCFCEIEIRDGDSWFVYNPDDEERLYYEVCHECHYGAPNMGYIQHEF